MSKRKSETSVNRFDQEDVANVEGKPMVVNTTKQCNLCIPVILLVYRKS
jgi:hypothetical protein